MPSDARAFSHFTIRVCVNCSHSRYVDVDDAELRAMPLAKLAHNFVVHPSEQSTTQQGYSSAQSTMLSTPSSKTSFPYIPPLGQSRTQSKRSCTDSREFGHKYLAPRTPCSDPHPRFTLPRDFQRTRTQVCEVEWRSCPRRHYYCQPRQRCSSSQSITTSPISI
jgi:hypothetical protein